jgi:hypothetical protein
MHGASVDASYGVLRGALGLQVRIWILYKSIMATSGAKGIHNAFMCGTVLGAFQIDPHATDGIFDRVSHR